MREIRKSFQGNYREIVLGPLFKLLETILELIVPLLTASIINDGVAGGLGSFVLGRGGLMVLLAVLGAAAALTCQYFAATAATRFGASLRSRVFAHVLRLSPAQAEEMGGGGLAARVTNDVNQVQSAVNMFIRLGTRVPFLMVGGIAMSMLLNLQAGLVFLVATLLITGLMVLVMTLTLPRYGKIQQGQDSLFRLAHENLSGVRVIRAFSRQKSEEQDFDEEAARLEKLLTRTGGISALLSPAASVLANLAIIVVVAARLRGQGDIGEAVALMNYMTQILLALMVGANLLVLFTRGVASAKRVEALLETAPTLADGAGATENPAAPALAFRQVCFRYFEGADKALDGLDLELWPGQTLGVIGGTGSGKSTLGHLLLRHYDVSEGSVEVLGADVRQYSLQALRAHFGVVPQTARLFAGTLRQNLQMAAPGAADETLWQALKAAQADGFVSQNPKGLDARVSEGGGGFSGGQRQRLTIARALARRPEILLLDDAASALDYATEAALRRALAGLKSAQGGPLTKVIISQRVASIRAADQILVLDNGRVAGRGSHGELLKHCEIYREICASQGLLSAPQTGGEGAGE